MQSLASIVAKRLPLLLGVLWGFFWVAGGLQGGPRLLEMLRSLESLGFFEGRHLGGYGLSRSKEKRGFIPGFYPPTNSDPVDQGHLLSLKITLLVCMQSSWHFNSFFSYEITTTNQKAGLMS